MRLFMIRHDNLFYNEITKVLTDDLALRGKTIRVHGNSFNSLIVQWYMEDVRNRSLKRTGMDEA